MSLSKNPNDNDNDDDHNDRIIKRNNRQLVWDIVDNDSNSLTRIQLENNYDDDDDDNVDVDVDVDDYDWPLLRHTPSMKTAIIQRGSKTTMDMNKTKIIDYDNLIDSFSFGINDDNNDENNNTIMTIDNPLQEIKQIFDEILEQPTLTRPRPSIFERLIPKTHLPQIEFGLFTKTTKIQSPTISKQKQQKHVPILIKKELSKNQTSSSSSYTGPIKLPEYSRQQCDRFTEQLKSSSNQLRQRIQQIYNNHRRRQLEQDKKFEEQLHRLEQRYYRHP